MKIALKNKITGEVKMVKVGWSWTLFFFSGFLGLPLFMRKLHIWGAVSLALYLAYIFVTYTVGGLPAACFGFIGFGLAIFFGMKGNEMTAKNLLENGWEFVEPAAPTVVTARAQWGLAV